MQGNTQISDAMVEAALAEHVRWIEGARTTSDEPTRWFVFRRKDDGEAVFFSECASREEVEATLERQAMRAALSAALAGHVVVPKVPTPRPLDEWHEDMGDVLWWYIVNGIVQEAPWVGTPNDCGVTVEAHTATRIITQVNQEHDPEPHIERIEVGGWPGYHTHWTPLPAPPAQREG